MQLAFRFNAVKLNKQISHGNQKILIHLGKGGIKVQAYVFEVSFVACLTSMLNLISRDVLCTRNETTPLWYYHYFRCEGNTTTRKYIRTTKL